MKKLFTTLLFIAIFTVTFAQLQVLNQKQISLKKNDEISVVEVGKKGFVVIQTTKSEESRKLRTWSFTLYNPELQVDWKKNIDIEKYLEVLASNTYEGTINIILYEPNQMGQKADFFVLLKVTEDGTITKKEIELEAKIVVYPGMFVSDCYYFDAIIKKDDVIAKFDFSSMKLTTTPIELPDKTEIFDRTTDGVSIYLRVKSIKKKLPYDAIYTIEDGVVVNKTNIKCADKTNIDFFNVILPDTSRKFVLGMTSYEYEGERKRDDRTILQMYLTNIEKEDIQTINNVDKKISDEFTNKRDISIKNKFFGQSYRVDGNRFITSSCFRFNDKNFMVFDKYQIIQVLRSCGKNCTYWAFEAYYYTNTIIWCFNDDGEVEWSRNFEYDIISPYFHAKTCARPYKDNTIALIGHFNNELSYKTISMDGDVIEGTEKQKVSNRSKFSELTKFNNSITHLYDNTYLIWGNDDDSKFGEEKSKSKKELNMIFKIVEFQ